MKQAFSKLRSVVSYLLCKLALYILRKRVRNCSYYKNSNECALHSICTIGTDYCFDCVAQNFNTDKRGGVNEH